MEDKLDNKKRPFWIEAYLESLDEIRGWGWFGSRGGFMSNLLAFIVVFIGLMHLAGSKFAVNTLWSALWLNIIAGAVLFLLFPIIAFVNIFWVIPKRHKSQKERLEDLDPDLSQITVEESNNELPPKDRVGIDIKNLTHEVFSGVIELIELDTIKTNEYCDESLSPYYISRDNCHFVRPNIIGEDREVIEIAKLEDGKCVFLTEKKISFDIKSGMPSPDFIKLKFVIQFEIRGGFKKEKIDRKYDAEIEVRSDINGITIEISDVEYVPKTKVVSRIKKYYAS